MASVDTTSVRTEVARLRTDFEKLCAEGKITVESKALMLGMFVIVELILSIFLERTTKTPASPPRRPARMTHR
jgi:hypothetical protein